MRHWLAPLSIFIALTASIPAQAEVLIAPTRVVLEKNTRSAELVIVNKSNEEAAFRVSIENRRMLLDGSMEVASEALDNELFAKDHIRFSPRRVIMEPGGRQTIRVQFTGSDLEPGEYRSHLRLMSAPTSAGRTLQNVNEGSDGISIQLIAIRSLTIPVIARVGALNAEVEIDTAKLNELSHSDGKTILEAHLKRTGDRSTYGNIELYVDGEAKPVYYARGVAVYAPNAERHVKLPLPDDITAMLKGQIVRVVYRSADPQSDEIFAEYSTLIN